MKKKTLFLFILLHINFLIYFSSSVMNKYAAKQIFFSLPFFIFYICSLSFLFLYSLFWQQLLRKIPLSTAYANKGVVIVWGICIGKLFFDEQVTSKMIFGAIIIIIGIILLSSANE